MQITALSSSPETITRLGEILMAVVAGGGSVGFMHPLDRTTAEAFWTGALGAASRGERIVLGAWIDGELAGTVSLLLALPPNQPHRAELAKMMTHPRYRRRGAAAALVREAERLAAEHGRTLLVLDTAAEEGASGFYERLGYVLGGEIPDYALKPHGGLTGTMLYWKRLAKAAAD